MRVKVKGLERSAVSPPTPPPKWSVVSGQWSVVSGQWSVVSGQWSVVSGQWSVVSGQWSVVSGQWSVVSGQWSVVSGQWSVVSGQWSVVSGQWSVVSGQWSVVSGQWSVVSGQSPPNPSGSGLASSGWPKCADSFLLPSLLTSHVSPLGGHEGTAPTLHFSPIRYAQDRLSRFSLLSFHHSPLASRLSPLTSRRQNILNHFIRNLVS